MLYNRLYSERESLQTLLLLHARERFLGIPDHIIPCDLIVGSGGFSLHARILEEDLMNHSLPALSFFLFFWCRDHTCTPIPLFKSGSVHSGSASWDNSGWAFPDEWPVSSFSRIGSHTMPELLACLMMKTLLLLPHDETWLLFFHSASPQWGTEDAEIKKSLEYY